MAIRTPLAMLRIARLFKPQENGFPRQCAHWLGMTERLEVLAKLQFTNPGRECYVD